MIDRLVSFFIISAVLGVAISYSKVYAFHIAYVALFTYLIVNYKFSYLKSLYKDNYKYLLFFIFFIIWYFISLLWTISPILYGLQYNLYIIMGVSIVTVLVVYSNSMNKLNKIFTILSFTFIIEIVLSLFELHPSFMLPIAPSSTIVEYFGRTRASDLPTVPTGFNWNQNDFAAVIVILTPFILYHKNLTVKFFLTISTFILVYQTNSRAGIISLVLLYILFFTTSKKRFFIGSIFLILFSIIIFFSPYKEVVKTKGLYYIKTLKLFIVERKEASGSILIRQKLINNGVEALRESNYLGVGTGGSIEVQRRKGGVYKNLSEIDYDYYKNKETAILNMHNFIIELLVDGGIIFFSFLLYWYLYSLRKLYFIIKVGTEQLRYYAKASILSMLILVPVSAGPSSMIYMLPMWILFGFVTSTIKIGDLGIKENYESTTII